MADKQKNTIERNVAIEDEMSLIDVIIVLARHKKEIIFIPLLVAIVTALAVGIRGYLSPQVRTKTVQLNLSLSSNVMRGPLPIKPLYTVINSTAISDSISGRVNLKKLFNASSGEDALRKYNNTVNATLKDDYINIIISDTDSTVVTRIAKIYPGVVENIIRNIYTERSISMLGDSVKNSSVLEDYKIIHDQKVDNKIDKNRSNQKNSIVAMWVIYNTDNDNKASAKKNILYIALSAVISIILVAIWVLFLESYRETRNDSKNEKKIDYLKELMKWK